MHSANPIIEADHLTVRYDSAYAAAAQTGGRDPDHVARLRLCDRLAWQRERLAGPHVQGRGHRRRTQK